MAIGQGSTVLAVGAGDFFEFFSTAYHISFRLPSLSGRRSDIDLNTVSKAY